MRYLFLLSVFAVVILCPARAHAASGSIGAGQCTAFRSDGTCSLILSWGTSGVSAAEVWVFPAAGSPIKLFTGTHGSQQLDWIQALPQQYTFSLYTTVNGSRGTLLASTSVAISSNLSLEVQPSASQSLNYGDTMNFNITVRDPSGNLMSGASVTVLDTLYGGAGSQFTVTTDSNGRATYGYTIARPIEVGNYTLTFGPATKAGWNQSPTLTRRVSILAPPKYLVLNVQPTGNVNARPGDSVTFTASVTDNNNNAVAGATVPVFNPLTANTSLTTNNSGVATYSFTVPGSAGSGTHTITFGQASASGYSVSEFVQRSLTVAAQTPVLTLGVQPADTQAALPGQSVTYTVTVRDGSNNLIQGAKVTVSNPFAASNSDVTTDANGSATYVMTVPGGQGAANYTVFFSGASKAGYTTSTGVSRLLTVTQASSPTAVLSLSAQAKTAGNGETLNLTVPAGSSVNVNFSASASSAGSGTITSYEWRSNNSLISTQAAFAYAFSTPSNSITLTVTNSHGLTATASALIVVAAGPLPDPTLSPSTASGPQLTTTFTTTGTNFTPNSSIQRYMTPPGGGLLVLAPVTSDANGQFTATYTTGCGDAAGTYQLLAVDPTTNKHSNTVTQTITASPGCVPTGAPTLNSNPSSGEQLTSYFPLTGGGYTPYGTVQLSISPSVNSSATLGQTTANANGLIYFVWATDCAVPAGAYTVTARDLTKNQSSPPFALTVNSSAACSTPGPKITQLSPNPMPGMSQAQSLTIFGSSFQPGLKVRLQKGGQAPTDYAQPDMVWSNQIRVTVNVGTSASNWTVQVINPDNTSSATAPLSVTGGNVPEAAALTDKPAVTRGAKITIRGANMTPGGAVQILLRLPDGKTVQVVANLTADSSGSITYEFDTGQVSSFGSHQLFYKDVSTGLQSNEIPSTINPVQNGAVTNKNHQISNDPIDTSTGNYTYDHTDFALPGPGLPIRFSRHYESLNPLPGPLGNGWTHSYHATQSTNPVDNSVTISMGNGYTVVFDLQGSAYRPRYENVYETLASPSAGIFVLTTRQQVKHTFNMGKLVSTSDRNGNTVSLSYSGTNVASITDAAGRAISLGYDSSNRLATVTYPVGRTLRYAYDAAGNLAAVTNARNKVTSYTYDQSSRMLAGTDPEGNRFVTNTYDALGRVSSQADGRGNTWAYSYDPASGKTTITDPNQKTSLHVHDSGLKLVMEQDSFGKQTGFGYDLNNNSTSVTDPNGHTTKRVLDRRGNVTQIVDALKWVSSTTYNNFNDPLSHTDQLSNTTTYTYDARGNLASVRDPLGNTTSYLYNPRGQVTGMTDAEGRTASNTYDAAGNLVQEQDALGNVTRYTYDDAGRRLTLTDAAGFRTSYEYDNDDNLTQVTDPLNGVIIYTYDGNNNRLTARDQRTHTTAYGYDANYKPATVTDPAGGTVTTAYDKLRNPSTVTDQRGGVTKTVYDSESRLVQTVDPVGNPTTYGYDPAENRVTSTDPAGKTTTYGYDALNRVTSVTDPLGAVSRTSYDPAGRVLTRSDAANNITTFVYDAAGRMTASTDAAGGTVRYGYDKVGNRTSVTDPRGKTTLFAYDSLNRLKTITDPLGNVASNTYDAVGNLVKVVDGSGNSRTYGYDANRRLTSVTYSAGAPVTYQYDAAGNRTKMIDGQGTSTYTYDELNRLLSYTHPLGTQMFFTYDAASNRTDLEYAPGRVVRYTFDAANRPASVTDWSNSRTRYTYDVAGRVSGVTFPSGVAAAYGYDAAGRTTNIQYTKAAASLYTEATSWSANGNPLSSSISGLAGAAVASETVPYTYDGASRLATISSAAVSNDKNDNVTSLPGAVSPTVFSYDLNNRATSISGPSVSAQMRYLGDGKLAELTRGGVTTRYLHDPGAAGNRILAELDSSGNIQRAYVHGLGMVSVLDGQSAYYYMHNLQGSTVGVTDGAGAVLASYRYDPFGNVIQSSGSLTSPFTFLGRYSVPTVGDYSVTTFRLYDARSGRFTGPDPAHWNLNAALSPFLYADQSPVRMIDPSGLMAELAKHRVEQAGDVVQAAQMVNLILAANRTALTSLSQYVRVGNQLVKVSKVLAVLNLSFDLYETYKDFTDDSTSLDTDAKRLAVRSVKLGLSAHPTFMLGYNTGNALFAPGQPLSPVIEGGSVGNTYIPGLGDFTKDVILDFWQNTRTVANTVGAGANAAGKWVVDKWNSFW